MRCFFISYRSLKSNSQKHMGLELIKLESLILAQNERWRRGLGMQVERSLSQEGDSGKRVSNAWVIFLWVRNNLPKGGLIPDETTFSKRTRLKAGILKTDLSPLDEPASYQLVGEVKAHQGDDG
jgi:hypothetical protein